MKHAARYFATLARYFAYASTEADEHGNNTSVFRNSKGRIVKNPSFLYVKVSCISHASLKLATIKRGGKESNELVIYNHCLEQKFLDPHVFYLFNSVALVPTDNLQYYRAFAYAVAPTKPPSTTRTLRNTARKPPILLPYEDMSAQLLVPMPLLPLGDKDLIDSVYLLGDWLCVYRDGSLLYDCVCKDVASFRDALLFIESVYGEYGKVFYYPCLACKSLDPAALKEEFADIIFTPIDKPLHELLHGFVMHHSELALYNPYQKHIFHSRTLWKGIGIACCCALIMALPFSKLIYATYLDSLANEVIASNNHLSQAIKAKNFASTKLPEMEKHIASIIYKIYSIRSHYTSRLEILSTLSQLINDNDMWISHFQLKGELEKGETLLEVVCRANNEEQFTHFLQALAIKQMHVISQTKNENQAQGLSMTIAIKI